MGVQLWTGNTGVAVTGSSDAALYASIIGPGKYVMSTGSKMTATLSNANTLVVSNGSAMINGRHVSIVGTEKWTIPSGAQSQKRSNVCVLRYEKDSDGNESVSPVTLTGAASAGNPVDPAWENGSILDGKSVVDMPLYRVVTDGINALNPVPLFEVLASAKAVWDRIDGGGLAAWPVGAVYISYVSTSPASLFGGTWVQMTGVFPYFGTSTATGGSNTHSLTGAQNGSHNHATNIRVYTKTPTGFASGAEGWLVDSTAAMVYTSSSGSGQAHNNMPAYQTLYAWRRTA